MLSHIQRFVNTFLKICRIMFIIANIADIYQLIIWIMRKQILLFIIKQQDHLSDCYISFRIFYDNDVYVFIFPEYLECYGFFFTELLIETV